MLATAIAAFITGIVATLVYQKFTGVFDKPHSSGRSSGGTYRRGDDPEIN